MSTSLQNMNDRFFPGVGNYPLADPHMQALQGSPVPVSLAGLNGRAAGWQKQYLMEKNASNGQTYSRPQYLAWERVNNPPRFTPPYLRANGNDPFGTDVNTISGARESSYCSTHLNQWAARRNPNAKENVRWRATIGIAGSTLSGSINFAALCATYTDFNTLASNQVCWSETKQPYWEIDETIFLPANGHPAILFSLQNTVQPLGVNTQNFGVNILNWEVTYV